jgi:hypothetical protein
MFYQIFFSTIPSILAYKLNESVKLEKFIVVCFTLSVEVEARKFLITAVYGNQYPK